jgi:SNF2 family DNA or RNA helicase
MVVAPVSLLENWQAEYAKFFEPKLTIHMPSPQDLQRMDWSELDKLDVLLMNYERLTRNALQAGQVDWGVIALDEAQKVKNPGTAISHVVKSMKSQFRIAMTGTPVENTLLDFWNIMDFVEPGLLGGKQEFAKRFKVQADDAAMLKAARELRELVGWHMLRRLKEDVARDLPTKTLEPLGWMPQDGLHQWGDELTEEQHRVYAGIQAQHEMDVARGGGPQAMLRAIEGWQLTCDHPLLAAKIWSKVEEAHTPALIRQSAKLSSTIAILNNVQARGEKALVFSKFRATQLLLKRVIQDSYGVDVSIINGDVPSSQQAATKAQLSRQALVDRFNASEGFQVMVLSPIAAGFGLNIQSANHVIHYTRHWNPAKEAQATDRAYRIGQTKPVTVYYPMSLSAGFKTFDANLHLLLDRKAQLAKEALFPSPSVELKDFNGLM